MVKKMQKTGASATSSPHMAGSVKDSAQQIWQAGLGAFAKAQAEGTRAFEALVKEGTGLQRKTQAAAEEKISEATSKMTSMATDISSKASGHWDKLENIFEERVAKALNKLGVPSAKDVNALIARIDELKQSVQKLSPTPATTRAAATKASGKSAPQATRKTSAKAAPKATPKAATKTVAKTAAKRTTARKST